MINVYHLASAAPIAMFGMFALWAAASKRHWFVRTIVVAAAVLATLLIPAYELAYQLGIESLVVASGMAIWIRRRSRALGTDASQTPRLRFSLSLKTLMLAVVIVAVSTAVIARTPPIEPHQWYDLVVSGVIAGAVCLACVWLACGRSNWQLRLLAAPFSVVTLAAAIQFFRSAEYFARHWIMSTTPIPFYWQIHLRDFCLGVLFWTISFGVGMAVLCAWLLLMRTAGWFDPFPGTAEVTADTPASRRRRVRAQWAAVVLFCVASLFPIALFYRLLTPTPIPKVILPKPNGFDDFVTAGRMVGPASAAKLRGWDQLTYAQLAAEISKVTPALDRMRGGLTKDCLHPYVFVPWKQGDEVSLKQLLDALYGQGALARRSGKVEFELENYLDLLRLAHAEGRGLAAENYNVILGHFEWDAHSGIWGLREQLSAERCKLLVAELAKLDHRREPWSVRVERQRIIEANAGWKRHAQVILQEWSGTERSPHWRIDHLRRVTELRILVIELSLRAYQLGHGRLPVSLSELVPEYLPAVPQDPFGNGDIRYHVSGNAYELYSIGPDGVDDGGKRAVIQNGAEVGDFTPAALFGPPIVVNQPVAKISGADSDP